MRRLRNLLALRRRVRLLVFLARLRVRARLLNARLELDVAPDVSIGQRVRIQVAPGSTSRIVMGVGCSLHDDVTILLKGGTLDFGEGVEVRRGTVMNLSGTFKCVGRNIISYSNVIHCAESITLDLYASTNEFVSIIDGTHPHDGEHEFFYENATSAPISIGKNSWIANKSSVLMGVTVGANCVVASHAVVNKDVPEASVAGGVPAKVVAVRRLGSAAMKFLDDPAAYEERQTGSGTPTVKFR